MNTLQIVQNNALRTILKRPQITRTRILDLHKTAKVEMLKIRFDNLNTKYVQKATISKNPIITELIEEFKTFSSGGRYLTTQTLLCKMLENNQI